MLLIFSKQKREKVIPVCCKGLDKFCCCIVFMNDNIALLLLINIMSQINYTINVAKYYNSLSGVAAK